MLGFLTAAFLSYTGVGLATAIAHRTGTLAHPGARGSHAVATPTGGGIGLVAALAVQPFLPGFSSIYPEPWLWAVAPGLVTLGAVGWADDRLRLRPSVRLAVQLAVSVWLLVCLPTPANPAPEHMPWPSWLAGSALVSLVWVMNAYNFMDGSDGMAGAEGMFAGLLLGGLMLHAQEPGLALAGFAIAGASCGFLPWNLPRARVFMGDAGSVPLGFALGALMLAGLASAKLSLPAALLVLAVFMVDAGMTLLKRVLAGERWYTAHRQHAYQRLIEAGWTHRRVMGLYQAFNMVLVLPAAVLGARYPALAWPLTGMVYMCMVAFWWNTSLKSGGNP